MPLDPASIEAFRPRVTTYKVTDGLGLYLEVHPSGAKYWRLRYRWAGKQNTISCGVYPETSLEAARERRDAARTLLAGGVDPSGHAKAERLLKTDEQARQRAATRFLLDNDGSLSFRLGARYVSLTPSETAELRAFLDATRSVPPRK